jgi:glycosyltransferase involved in cell wall biosynthesis
MFAVGPGDVVAAHRSWRQNRPHESEVTITCSSQIEDAFKRIPCVLYLQSNFRRAEVVADGSWTIENRPERHPDARGIAYHTVQTLNGLRLLAQALRFKADLVFVDSGRSHWFSLIPFKLARIKVVPVLHNALWPAGKRPRTPVKRLIQWLDGRFWRSVPSATIVVSPECERQVAELGGGRSGPIFQMRGQYHHGYFDTVAPPPPHEQRPFVVMYAGRIERDKGVFDVVALAAKLQEHRPGQVEWEICGKGSVLEELRQTVRQQRLEPIVKVHGALDRDQMAQAYGRAHVVVVPTRSNCAEAFALVAAEAVLAGRPFVASRIVPASEVLADACVIAQPDDVDSYGRAIESLMADKTLYDRKSRACPEQSKQFLDPSFGIEAAIGRVLKVICAG